jgi:hypothetical protein
MDEVQYRIDMARHLRLLAEALENPDLASTPVDWESIRRRVGEIIENLTVHDDD